MKAITDQDALLAAVDLIGRTGSKEFQIGYLHDDVPIDKAGWWAHATYKGARISVEDHHGPIEAAEALARRILVGGRCKCGKLVALSDDGAMAYNGLLPDGSRWTVEDARAAGQCRWRRYGRRWQQGCEPLPAEYATPTEAETARAARKARRRKP